MVEVSDEQFEKMVADAMDALAKQLADVKNVGIVIAEEPDEAQREKLQLRGDQSLFGLYEGIPLTKRNSNYSGVLPDKITIFKLPLASSVHTVAELQKAVHHTLWHELGHHYGLEHSDIYSREGN
jgi:predicted Zn-dependent protease with MMP-like domain